MPNDSVSVRILMYQATHKKHLAAATLDPNPEDLEAQECMCSPITKIEKLLLGREPTNVKRYPKK